MRVELNFQNNGGTKTMTKKEKHFILIGTDAPAGIVDRDAPITIMCSKCKTELYTSELSLNGLKGKTVQPDAFDAIGDQPCCKSGKAPPFCHVCGSVWLGVFQGDIIISTTQGLFTYSHPTNEGGTKQND